MQREASNQYFKQVYEEEGHHIFRFVLLRINNREEAIDITEETFFQFWRMVCEGERIANTRALLFTIARNKVIDWYRRHKPTSLDHLLERGEDSDKAEFDVAEPEAMHDLGISSEAKWVMGILQRLPPQYKEVVEMRFVEGLTPLEIAQILRITQNAASLRINHALERLRKELRISLEDNE